MQWPLTEEEEEGKKKKVFFFFPAVTHAHKRINITLQYNVKNAIKIGLYEVKKTLGGYTVVLPWGSAK